MIRYFIIGCLLIFINYNLRSQTDFSYESKNFEIPKRITKLPNSVIDWQLQIQNLQAPSENNKNYQAYLNQLKTEISQRFPRKEFDHSESSERMSSTVLTPQAVKEIEGNVYNGSVPNDNTMAISNDGILISSINTNLIFYDTENDTLLASLSLNAFSDTLTTVSTNQYDPKVLYDYAADRFVVVFLAGSSSDTKTNIIVSFSTSKNPLDPWNFYTLPGNPLNDTSWSDFPAIAFSNGELFITMNLLRYGGSWQTSFKQSVIWQVNKLDGYTGNNLRTKLYSNINFGGVNIRNMHPVIGGNTFYGPQMYFLSNRNFSLQCDSIFLLKTNDLISNNPVLECNLLRTDKMYGAPPNARQAANKWLATNDARVLGAFIQGKTIQFVGNTIDTLDGKATCYHGIIDNVDLNNPIKLKIFKDSMEYGYPNISYCGNGANQQSIISLHYTSATTFAGLAAINYNNGYSSLKILKSGETHISILLAGLQRWGDYSGSQPQYNKPGKVWISGTYGKLVGSSKRYGTWLVKLQTEVDIIPSPSENSVKLFPNPSANSRVNIDLNLKEKTEVTIEVLSLNGVKVYKIYEGNLNAGPNSISFSTEVLSAGLYIVRISSKNQILSSKKLSVL